MRLIALFGSVLTMAMGLGGARADEMATDAAGRASPSASIPAGAARSNGQATAGFETRADGSTSLSVETSQPLSYGTLVGRGRITYVLKGARVGHRNNSNPLVTVHFNTPVTRAQLLPRGRDLWFVIDLRASVQPTVTTEPAQGGRWVLRFDFPKGDYLNGDQRGPDKPATTAVPAAPRAQVGHADSEVAVSGR